jgi:hypothetical protein
MLAVFVAALLASGFFGRWLVPVSVAAIALLIGWYQWPRLRHLRLRWPVYTPSHEIPPIRQTEAGYSVGLTEEARRRHLRKHLVFLAQSGDQRATHPPYIQQRWIGATNDLLQNAFGHEVVETVLGFAGFREKVAALRTLIRDLDNQQLRPDFDPRDHDGMAV